MRKHLRIALWAALCLAYIALLMLVASTFSSGCSSRPTLITEKSEAGYNPPARGCTRDHSLDFGCTGHEFLKAAYHCPVELDACKSNDYGSYCCWPVPGEE